MFFLSVGNSADGMFLIFFPLFPLLLAGLSCGAGAALVACATGALAALLFTGLEGAFFFLGFLALPAGYFARRALLWRGDAKAPAWYPVLRILAEVTTIAAACFMALALGAASQGGLQALLPPTLGNGFTNADPELAAMAQSLVKEDSFMLFAFMGWLWVLMLYGFAVLANSLLKIRRRALRPSLAIEQDGLPAWLLVLLALNGALALLGQGLDLYTAKLIFLLLLLPYLLGGIASVHAFSLRRQVAFRRAWLGCFYTAILCSRWPLLMVIALGLYRQIAEMLDRRNKIR